MEEPQKFYLRTYGCQMNELDTEIMAGILTKRGMTQTAEEEEADLLIFNTCSIRDLAERKVMGKLGKLGRQKKKKRIIGITGCMANAKKSSFFQKLPHVDFVLGTNNIHDLSPLLDQVISGQDHVIKTDKRFSHELDYLNAQRTDKYKAHVSIIRGCDKHCTYCVVPYTRGPEVSRPPENILEECKKLADQGYKELTLLGQNVNSYGKDQKEWNYLFHDLLYQIDKIPGINRVRFLTSHPVDITRELMEAIRDLPSLCEHVHFPLQAGSNRILKKMHRIYTKEEYMEKVDMLRSIAPNVALGTDMIVGFPTETEEEFLETYEAMQKVRYANAFLYTYSPRKGTPAIRWADDIPEKIKSDRLQRLLTLHNTIASEIMQEMVGKKVEVLVEAKSKDGAFLRGVTRTWHKVLFKGEENLIGSLQEITLNSFTHNTFIGSVQTKSSSLLSIA